MCAERSVTSVQNALIGAAADGVANPKRFEGDDPKAAIAFILRQISMTVLGRVVTFAINDHPDLVCEVSGRRLIGVPSLDVDHSDDSGDAPAWLSDFVATVQDHCATVRQISVTITPLDNAGEQWRDSVSVDQLVQAFDLADGDADTDGTADSIAQFLSEAANDFICAQCVAGDAVETLLGGEADLQRLKQRASSILPGLAGQNGRVFTTLGRQGMLVVGAESGVTEDLLIGAFDGVYLLGLVKPKGHEALPARWLAAQG